MHHRWKILAPVDLGSEAEVRVQHALDVAEAIHGDLTLLYVTDGRSKRAEPVEWPANAMVTRGDGGLRRLVLVGSVGQTVGRYADDLGADLITLTDNPYRWWDRLWRRSAAGEIATATERPVCFVPLSAPTPATAFRSMVCVVGLDGADDALLRFTEEVAQRSDATLVFLHVLPDVSERLMAYGVPGVDDRPLSREVAEKRLRDLTSGVSRPHLPAITTGSAYRSIANVARDHKADVVITGRRHAWLSGLDSGTVSSRVSCPVISVPVASRRPLESSVVHRRLTAVGKP